MQNLPKSLIGIIYLFSALLILSSCKLPKPGDDAEIQNQIKNNEIQEILKVGENNNDSPNNESDLLKNMKKKIQ